MLSATDLITVPDVPVTTGFAQPNIDHEIAGTTSHAGQTVGFESAGLEPRVGDVQGILQRVLWNLQTSRKHVERRRAQRHAYPYPLRIWPANACNVSKDGTIETRGEGTTVMGKHLSVGGLDFYTQKPVTDRKVMVGLDGDGGPMIQILVELTWCRFGGHGMYINGGRFIRS